MNRDHSKFICDISELASLFKDTANFDILLQKIVEMIAVHMEADVCSIYLYYQDTDDLILKTTKGLDPSSVGNVRLKLGEGLTGKCALEMRPVCEGDALKSPAFKFFSGIGEEKFPSFLAVPILRGQTRIGVMTLQRARKNYFTAEDVNVFRAITSQMAHTIEIAKLLMSLERPDQKMPVKAGPGDLKFVKGRVGAEGFALGEVLAVRRPAWDDLMHVSGEKGVYALEDFYRAVAAAEQELESMQRGIETRFFDVASLIFAAQILMLKDHGFLGQIETRIRNGENPPEAVRDVVRSYVERFEQMDNEYVREKRYDVLDVGHRVLENMVGRCDRSKNVGKKIVIARELLPSEAMKLASQDVAGIVLLSGGVTSHLAVLARSLNIPLVITDEERLLNLEDGVQILLDGSHGNVFIRPGQEVVDKFREKEELSGNAAGIKRTIRPETRTKDGVRVKLLANINLLGDLVVARDYRAEGVGLYRTEFPFLVRNDFPTEEEQYVIYRKLVEGMAGREVTFRTLDIGGDKMLSYYAYGREANPFLGLRSIRFSLRHKDIFAQQIRAILRAGAGRDVRIMFPMISSVDDLREARAVVEDCLGQLKKARAEHQADPSVGVMLELPAVVEVLDDLAREVDFFSIGTNDLIQYLLAVDRTNEKVADLYVPHHPAILRTLKRMADVAARFGRDISVCGDMAHDVRYVPFLVGIGIRKLSLDARYLPKVQEAICGLDACEAETSVAKALSLGSVAPLAKLFSVQAPGT